MIRCSERGQATVEFAVVLPFILFAALALLDVSWLAIDQCRVNDAARVAARAAVVEDADFTRVATDRVRGALGTAARVSVEEDNGLITVRVQQRHEFVTPVLTLFLKSTSVTASMTMLLEPRVSSIGG